MSQGLVVLEDKRSASLVSPPPETPSLMTVAAGLASNPNADLDKVQRVLEILERQEMKFAEKAFNKAFAAFKGEAANVVKNVTYTDGPLKGKKYADLGAVVETTSAVLSRHGLSTSWKQTKDEPQWIEITCILRHELGHSEAVAMGGPPDTGPARNAVQSRKSTTSYLERYTLLAILGLATEDDDGAGAQSPADSMEPDARKSRLATIQAAKNDADLKSAYDGAVRVAGKDKASAKAFEEAKNARYRELHPVSKAAPVA